MTHSQVPTMHSKFQANYSPARPRCSPAHQNIPNFHSNISNFQLNIPILNNIEGRYKITSAPRPYSPRPPLQIASSVAPVYLWLLLQSDSISALETGRTKSSPVGLVGRPSILFEPWDTASDSFSHGPSYARKTPDLSSIDAPGETLSRNHAGICRITRRAKCSASMQNDSSVIRIVTR